MKRLTQVGICLIGLGFVTMPICAGGAKGNLGQVLIVKQIQGGFAGDTGWLWRVEPNGTWKKMNVFNQKLTPKGQGKFTAAQLKTLTEALDKYSVKTLPAKSGKPSVNRQMLTIQYGNKTSQYLFMAGALLPKADAKTVPGRFGGIVGTVKELTNVKQGVPK